jgi:hypothetical protein
VDNHAEEKNQENIKRQERKKKRERGLGDGRG